MCVGDAVISVRRVNQKNVMAITYSRKDQVTTREKTNISVDPLGFTTIRILLPESMKAKFSYHTSWNRNE